MNWYIQSSSTKYFSTLTTDKRAILELWCEVQVYHATLNLLVFDPPTPTTTPFSTTVPPHISHLKSAYYLILHQGKLFFVVFHYISMI